MNYADFLLSFDAMKRPFSQKGHVLIRDHEPNKQSTLLGKQLHKTI